ncbi:hypothetical protein BHE74_00002307 [Ensete ventricosum]|nr:hypothetical protein BHE74_00002307 [Ensete ventricosum]
MESLFFSPDVFGYLTGVINTNGVDQVASGLSAADVLPKDGSEWVELFVREMMSATDMDDARSRASRVLESVEKWILAQATTEALQSFHKVFIVVSASCKIDVFLFFGYRLDMEQENTILKNQLEVLLKENTILKHAVAIQHGRQKDYNEKSQELQHLRHLVSQYQEQLKTLEVFTSFVCLRFITPLTML